MISAKSLPSAGYTWEVTNNECGARFEMVDESFTPQTDLEGAPGTQVWTYTSPPPSSNYVRNLPCQLTFEYKGPTDQQPVKVKQVSINVL